MERDGENGFGVVFSNLINGRPRGKFRGEKEIQQGDPFSPFLFNLIVDVLGRLIDKAKERNLIRGMQVVKGVSHSVC